MSTATKPPRITEGMDLFGAVLAIGEGNPGAISVLSELIKQNEQIGTITLHLADQMDIRGPLLWMLYSDFAKTHMRMAALLVLCDELGLCTPEELQRDIEISRRTGSGPSVFIETALQQLPNYHPLFAGIDLKKPEPAP